jgi:hypothetical protein
MLDLAAERGQAARLAVLGDDSRVIYSICVVILASPAFNQDFGFLQGVEDLLVQQFTSHLAIERLDVAVFPGPARLGE